MKNDSNVGASSVVIHRANTRGHAFHGWLNANHSFSFANYYDPRRMGFWALRVLNDDSIAPGAGFPKHPHDNMEIITVPLEGALEHKDSMGNGSVIRKGEIQVMSAGTGVFHSEFNASKTEYAKLLQIWVYAKNRGVEPRYDQFSFRPLPKNALKQIVSPNPDDEGSWIHQDAWFHFGSLEKGNAIEYGLKKPGNGIYVFVIEGSVTANGTVLDRRDGAGFVSTPALKFEAGEDSEFLVIEVPLTQ